MYCQKAPSLILLLFLQAHFVTPSEFSNKGLIQPVPLFQVRLQAASQFEKAVSLNTEYLLGIDSDRLLKTFRLTAGIEAPGEPFAGSWEDPSCDIRGQFLGHWLSGTAMLGKNTGNKTIIQKADYIINELKKVQEALGGGYLSAFPTEHFLRLRKLQGVWAPFYVIHKIMAGLLDHYLFLGNKVALTMVLDEADFFLEYIEDIFEKEGEAHWVQMLEIEYGGMEEVLFNLYSVTGEKKWARMATYFTKPSFFGPLKERVDTLPGRHANTHLAQVNGFAAGYEVTGDVGRLAAVKNFFDIILESHSYATGGNSDGEFWQAPQELAVTLAAEGAGRNTEETCTTYNMMKIARYLFRWSGDPKYADYYETAVLNGMIGTQRMPSGYDKRDSGLEGFSRLFLNLSRFLQNPLNLSFCQMHHHWKLRESPGAEEPNVQATAWGSLHNSSLLGFNAGHANWRQMAFSMFPGPEKLPEGSNAPGPGVIIYLLPLGAGNNKDDSFHHWSTPLNSFWCCSGSTAESFGKLMDSIFFQRQREAEGSPPELYVNQLVSSQLHWELGRLDISLNASLYGSGNIATAEITFEPFSSAAHENSSEALSLGESTQTSTAPLDAHSRANVFSGLLPELCNPKREACKVVAHKERFQEAVVKLRIPAWAVTADSKVVLNDGEVLADGTHLQPGTFLALRRKFISGDKIKIKLAMNVTTEPINDWRPEFQNLRAVKRGPLVMAAITDGDRSIEADPNRVSTLLQEVSTEGLVTLATIHGEILIQKSAGVSLSDEAHCLPASDCTFRLWLMRNLTGTPQLSISNSPAAGQQIVLESMNHPGYYVIADQKGGIKVERQAIKSLEGWTLRSGSSPGRFTLAFHNRTVLVERCEQCENGFGRLLLPAADDRAADLPHFEFFVQAALGSYPQGAKVLKGNDKSFVVAPLGNLIEEKYSPYLEFTQPSVQAGL